MRSILIAITVAALFVMLTPVSNAAESVTAEYRGSAGYYVEPLPAQRGRAFVICPNCDFSDWCEDVPNIGETCVPEHPVPPPVGGVRLYASTTYNSAIIKPNDDVYGSGAAISACFYDPAGDFSCDRDPDDGDNDFPSDWVCGTVPLVGAPFSGDYVTVWAITILVNEDLTTCGSVAGTITGDFFNA